MKPFLSLIAVAVLLSACTVANDYPAKHKYYSTNNVVKASSKTVKHRRQVPRDTYNEELQEVCVGQWCRCESD